MVSYSFKPLSLVLCMTCVILLGADTARPECRDGAWRVEKKNPTTGAVSSGERLDVLLGSYWAHLGLAGQSRISELRRIEAPGKFRLVFGWHPESVGKIRDRSVGWQETCEGDRMVQVSLQEPMEGGKDKVQYTYTRLPTEPSRFDGVWTALLENVTSKTSLKHELTSVRYGDYIAWFLQPAGEELDSALLQAVSPGKWKVLLSTNPSLAGQVQDHSIDRSEQSKGDTWVVQWTAASSSELRGFQIEKGDRISATLSPLKD